MTYKIKSNRHKCIHHCSIFFYVFWMKLRHELWVWFLNVTSMILFIYLLSIKIFACIWFGLKDILLPTKGCTPMNQLKLCNINKQFYSSLVFHRVVFVSKLLKLQQLFSAYFFMLWTQISAHEIIFKICEKKLFKPLLVQTFLFIYFSSVATFINILRSILRSDDFHKLRTQHFVQ